MKTTSAFTTGFPSLMTTAVLFIASGACATQESVSKNHAVSHVDAEALLNFRIEELSPRHSLSACIKDLKRMQDQKLLDPQLSAYDMRNKSGLLNLHECTDTKAYMPSNRRYLRRLSRLAAV